MIRLKYRLDSLTRKEGIKRGGWMSGGLPPRKKGMKTNEKSNIKKVLIRIN